MKKKNLKKYYRLLSQKDLLKSILLLKTHQLFLKHLKIKLKNMKNEKKWIYYKKLKKFIAKKFINKLKKMKKSEKK